MAASERLAGIHHVLSNLTVSFPGRNSRSASHLGAPVQIHRLPRRASLQLVILIVGAHPASSSSSAFQVCLSQSANYTGAAELGLLMTSQMASHACRCIEHR